jgi:hypothetical protein
VNDTSKIECNGVEYYSEKVVIPDWYMKHFDFIDLGAKHGSMRNYARDSFNGRSGLHFELNPDCIAEMEKDDIPCVQADVTNLDLPENCVDFVISTHTIEHLPSREHVKKMMESSKKAAKDFIYITWPSFDSEDYLKENGFLKHFSTDISHTYHITSTEFAEILDELNLEYVMKGWPVHPDSNHPTINWLDESRERVDIHFDRTVCEENVCLIKIRDSVKYQDALEFLHSFIGWVEL